MENKDKYYKIGMIAFIFAIIAISGTAAKVTTTDFYLNLMNGNVTLLPGGNVSIDTDVLNKTITIDSVGGGVASDDTKVNKSGDTMTGNLVVPMIITDELKVNTIGKNTSNVVINNFSMINNGDDNYIKRIRYFNDGYIINVEASINDFFYGSELNILPYKVEFSQWNEESNKESSFVSNLDTIQFSAINYNTDERNYVLMSPTEYQIYFGDVGAGTGSKVYSFTEKEATIKTNLTLSGNLNISKAGKGITLYSPNGSSFCTVVSDLGTLTTTAGICI